VCANLVPGLRRKPKDWDLDSERLEAFLRRLDEDPERAGLRYIRLHARLEKYILNNSLFDPNYLADRTIDRLVGILEDDSIESSQIESLAIGIARNIVREERRRMTFWVRLAARFRGRRLSRSRTEHECVEWALKQLPEHEREFIEDFYSVRMKEGGLGGHRRLLAQRLAISYDALRRRACEVRRKLRRLYEACCTERVS